MYLVAYDTLDNALSGVACCHAGGGSVGIIGSGWWIMPGVRYLRETITRPFVRVKPQITDRSVIKR